MKQKPQEGKRVVSKGAYVAVKAKKTVLSWSGLLLAFAGIACIVLTLFCASYALVFLLFSWSGVFVPIAATGAAVFFGCCARLCRQVSDTTTAKADNVEDVIPLTRANTANLPVSESLVRASQESVQAQEAVLLRAAVGGPEKDEEQLLRAAAGGQE